VENKKKKDCLTAFEYSLDWIEKKEWLRKK
jgi:hypothetical protein